MKIVVNGQPINTQNSITIAQLLKELKVEDKVMAVAINMEVIKKDKWSTHQIKEGDKLELLHFVGGG
ncbi:MAG: sulfur carrier protein ThiS [Epsilonproteobacteria bacterium]|nr:sulfur carrier protein ThiS [Campylobacterota bacterium]